MPFTDQEYFEVIEKNETVKKAFENIKKICLIIEGQAKISTKNGNIYMIKAGDLVEFPAGLYCEWEVTKSIKKHYRLGS